MNEAERLAKSTDHIQTICYLLNMRLIYGMASGDHHDAERCLKEVLPIAQEHNLALWLAMIPMCTEIFAAYNGDKISMERWQKAESEIDTIKFKLFIASFRVDLARSALAMGFHDDAAELAMKAQELIDETGETFALSDLHRLQAAIALADDDTATAEQCLVRALDVARRQGAKFWELRAAIDLAGLWRDQGKTAEAISLLQPVHDSIADGDCPNDRATARELLAALAG